MEPHPRHHGPLALHAVTGDLALVKLDWIVRIEEVTL